MGLLSELKRRNVIRVSAAYLVSSWLLIEMADIMFPAFGFPPGALRGLIGILGLGLIPMIVFSWAYELTEQGLVRDRGPEGETPQNAKTARRLDQVTIAMILLALIVVAIERFVVPHTVAQTPVAADPQPVQTSAPPPMEIEPMPIPEGPSVAVLPFANMSADPENEFFADGISEEILNVLAGIEGLKVASRTSAFSFKGKDTAVPDIARQLGVAHVLEGSVRKSGDRVRITAQLIDASNDAHLWSDSYDRNLTDIFAVQEEIANAISAALGEALGVQVGNVAVAAPTENLEAYEHFLRGRQLFYQRGDALRPAREHLVRAVELDPEFADAWAVLSGVYSVSGSYLAEFDEEESRPLAVDAARRAIELDDGLALPHAVLGMDALNRGDAIAARRHLDAARAREPSNVTVNLWTGIFQVHVGHVEQALESFERAAEADPLVGIVHGWLGGILVDQGRTEEGLHHARRSIELGFPFGYLTLAEVAFREGDRERAADRLRDFFDRAGWNSRGDRPANARADAIVQGMRDPESYDPALDDLQVALAAGRIEEGLMVRRASGWDAAAAGVISSLSALPAREHPLYFEIAEEQGYVAYWERYGYPDGCERVETPEAHLECAR